MIIDPARDAVVASILAACTRLSGGDEGRLLAPLFTRFARWVGDLPASERNHHARPYGLLDHSLDTARLALLQWERHADALDRIAPPAPDQLTLWLAAAAATALLHDVGKVLEFDVQGSSGDAWDPVEEPQDALHPDQPDSPWAPRVAGALHGAEGAEPVRLHEPGDGGCATRT